MPTQDLTPELRSAAHTAARDNACCPGPASGALERAAHSGLRVLLAENDDTMRSLLASDLRRHGYQVETCPTGLPVMLRACSYLSPTQPHTLDLVVCDVRSGGATGLEVFDVVRGAQRPPDVLITAFGDAEAHAQAHMLDFPHDEIDDGADGAQLLERLEAALERTQTQCHGLGG